MTKPISASQAHIHTPDDGKGSRSILLDGQPVENAIYADEHEGIVIQLIENERFDKVYKTAMQDELINKGYDVNLGCFITLKGKVTVEFING